MNMMSGTNGKKKLSALLLASLMTTSLAFADSYKNNVVDVRVNKESGNAVKVMIYTDRPYTEPVVVNKKANNKYVILMPETKSSLRGAPKMNNVSGSVSNVTVNTQAVSGGKGYTKITITSDHAINVVPRTQQLATSKHTTHPADTKAKSAKIAVAKNTTQHAVKSATKPTTQKPAEKKPTTVKTASNNQKHFVNPLKKATKPEVKPVKQAAKPTPKPVTKPAVSTKKIAAKPAQKPIDVLEHEVKTNTNAPLVDNSNDAILNKEIQENDVKIEKERHEKRLARLKKRQQRGLDKPKPNKHSFDFAQLGIWKLLLLAGAITFPIIVIMIILALDKKINKKIERNFRHEEPEVGGNTYIPSNKPLGQGDYTEPAPQEPTLPEPEEPAAYTSFDDMLNKAETENQYSNDFKTPDAEPATGDETFNNDYVDEDFEHDFSNNAQTASEDVSQTIQEMSQNNVAPVQDNIPTEQPAAPTEPVENNTQVPETPVVDNAQTEELIDKPAELSVPETAAPQENQYNPDGYLSDFSNIDDKDFFDELAMQTMAQNNSANGLPEQSPADEIFDYMSDDTEEEEPQITAPQEPQIVEPALVAKAPEPVQNVAKETEKPQEQTTDDDTDDLTMLTEVKLNDHAGIYLVNYDNFSSLVGHIDDDYFVLKKFNNVVEDKIYLKETEKTDNATRYIVRVGKNKMVVEVSDTSMSRLLDL